MDPMKKKALDAGLMDEKTYEKNLTNITQAIQRLKSCEHSFKFIKGNQYPYVCSKCGLLSVDGKHGSIQDWKY